LRTSKNASSRPAGAKLQTGPKRYRTRTTSAARLSRRASIRR
jgi:hypothetical protein